MNDNNSLAFAFFSKKKKKKKEKEFKPTCADVRSAHAGQQ
jgi:hypothetical protein